MVLIFFEKLENFFISIEKFKKNLEIMCPSHNEIFIMTLEQLLKEKLTKVIANLMFI
jgi:hypothetical protein